MHGASEQCMQATEIDFSAPTTPSLMVTTRRRFTPQGTSFSFLQAVTQPLHSMQRSASAFGLISTKFSCISSANQGLERVSSPPPSYSTRRPEVRMIGNSLPMYLFFSCTDLKRVGRRQNTLTSSWVGYFSIRSGR